MFHWVEFFHCNSLNSQQNYPNIYIKNLQYNLWLGVIFLVNDNSLFHYICVFCSSWWTKITPEIQFQHLTNKKWTQNLNRQFVSEVLVHPIDENHQSVFRCVRFSRQPSIYLSVVDRGCVMVLIHSMRMNRSLSRFCVSRWCFQVFLKLCCWTACVCVGLYRTSEWITPVCVCLLYVCLFSTLLPTKALNS